MAFQIVKNIFYFLICVASVSSNSLLIAILLRFEHLRTTANLFVLNLAFCDVAIVLLSIPFTVVTEEAASYPFGELGCKVLMPSATAAFNSAAFTLLAIAIDRFYAIMFPMRARLQSCKTKSLAVCLVHGVSISSVIPFAIHQQLKKDGNSYKCVEHWPEGGSKIYTLVLFCIQYLIPLTVIAVLYSISWNQIRKKNKVIIKMQELQQKGKCHFSRSQSWDVAMKKSESFPYLIGETSKGTEKQMIQSISNYSFKSSQLEAVEENNDNERGTGEQNYNGDNESDVIGIERPEDEQMLVINMSKKRLLEKRHEDVKNKRKKSQQTYQNGIGSHLHNGLGKYSKTDNAEEILVRASDDDNDDDDDDDDRHLEVTNTKVKRSTRSKLKRALQLETKCPWLKSDCLPKKMKRSKKNCKDHLETQAQSISEEDESGMSLHSGKQENWKLDNLKLDENTVDAPESEGNTEAKHRTEDPVKAIPLQSKKAEHRVARGIPQAESTPHITKKISCERNPDSMSHSISSPTLRRSSHGTTRRQSSHPSLTKGTGHTEPRLSKISQIAMQAKQKVTHALNTNSTENMCTASIKRMKQTRRTLRMFTCVVVVFAVCILPNQITWIWMAFNGAHLNHVLYTVFYFLTYTNSVLNPWIYGAVNPSFRKAYRKMFCCKSKSNTSRNNDVHRTSSKLTYLCAHKDENDVMKSKKNSLQMQHSST